MIKKAIYVGGCDRSGTTMLGELIGRHENIVCTPESNFKTKLLDLERKNKFTPLNIIKVCSTIPSFKSWGVKLDNNFLADVSDTRGFMNKVINGYISDEAKVWVDHTPINLARAYKLKNLFEESYFIHIIRDPRAVINSLLKVKFGPTNAYMACDYWKKSITENESARYQVKNYLTVRYEDLLNNQDEVISKIFDFVNEPNVGLVSELKPKFKVPNYTANQHVLVGQNADKSRKSAWMNELSEKDLRIINTYLIDPIRNLNYPINDFKYYNVKPLEKLKFLITDLSQAKLYSLKRKSRI